MDETKISNSKLGVIEAYRRGYRINDDGNMVHNGKIIQGTIRAIRYLGTNIMIDGKCYHVMHHQLCAFQKYGEDLLKAQVVRHLNDVATDNRPCNIAIGSYKENYWDMKKVNRDKSLKIAKLSRKRRYDYLDVLEFYNNCHSYKKTKEKFGIKNSASLFYIINRMKIIKDIRVKKENIDIIRTIECYKSDKIVDGILTVYLNATETKGSLFVREGDYIVQFASKQWQRVGCEAYNRIFKNPAKEGDQWV